MLGIPEDPNHYLGQFARDIRRFNAKYNMPVHRLLDFDRLDNFVRILKEEVDEYREIRTRVELADWLGDIMIYCASEMVRNSMDPSVILDIIMRSNASKMGPDGKPIYDERGKLLKGPNFKPPEPAIREYFRRSQEGTYTDG